MKIFGFGNPKPEQPTLEEKLSQALAETANSAPQNAGDALVVETESSGSSAIAEPSPLPLNDVAEFPEDYAPPSEEELENSDVAETEDLPSAMPLEIEPLRALFPGSFLGGQYEIKEVISRGAINYYLADAGDYGAHDFKIIGERISTKNESATLAETDFITAETASTKNQAEPQTGPSNASFFVEATRFFQEQREYAAWDFESLQSLQDWSAPPNDETYFAVMGSLARAFAALENANFQADLPPSSLFFDGARQLKYFGFFDAVDENSAPPMSAIQQLSALSSRFAKTNLAAGATLRLDDEFGALPFSEEVKSFAQKLSEGEFSNAREVVIELEKFAIPQKMEAALLTDVGMERELNEDCGLLWKSSRAGHARNFEIELLAVADGMGGHEGGEVASDVTLCALESALGKRQVLDFSDNSVVFKAMNEILLEVNDAVVRLTENPPYASMRAKPGATLVCALRIGPRLFIGNVGDSRAYRWNAKSGLQRITKDHSYVQDLLDSGSISPDEAWGHPDGSVITSHIGMMRGLKKDVFLRHLGAGDRLILVSDGVVDMLRDAEIEAIVTTVEDASQLCAALVNAANDAGGADNITVAALICE